MEYLSTKPSEVSKEMAFKLYDTYGFPLELTKEIALEAGISTDEEGFKQEMQEQKERARAARNTINSMNRQSADLLNFDLDSTFVYNPTPITSKVIALFKDGVKVDVLEDDGEVVLETTTFYAESGGQVADTGCLVLNGNKIEVRDVQKAPRKQHLHSVETNGLTLKVGDEVQVVVDLARRNRITRNHSACHLLQKALQEVLGNGVHQAGSYVDDEKLRFDFTYVTKISPEQLKLVERKVNEAIDAAYVTNIQELPI
jgi:alanyl-tRNA synthetase